MSQPPWLVRNLTEKYIDMLRQAEFGDAPYDPDIDHKFASIFHRAGVAWRFRPSYYRGYVATGNFIMCKAGPMDPKLPDSEIVSLSEMELKQSEVLKSNVDALAVEQSKIKHTTPVSVKLFKYVTNRFVANYEMYLSLVDESNPKKVAKAVTMNFVTTSLGALDILDFENLEYLNTCSSCAIGLPPFVAGPTGVLFALSTMIGWADTYNSCKSCLDATWKKSGAADYVERLDQEFRRKQLSELMKRRRGTDSTYYTWGEDEVTLRDKSGKVDDKFKADQVDKSEFPVMNCDEGDVRGNCQRNDDVLNYEENQDNSEAHNVENDVKEIRSGESSREEIPDPESNLEKDPAPLGSNIMH
jgi:hypothetical protein